MAARTTAELIGGIIEVDSTISLTPFITAANMIVTRQCVTRYASAVYTDDELAEIELWLSAHFYCIRDPRATSESAGGVSASYQHATALGFDSTEYGSMAMRLDSYGGLAALNHQMKNGRGTYIGVSWLGKTKEEKEAEEVEE
jgi:hypothetical protein